MSEGGINYHAPLKSVRTRRAIVFSEPPKLSFDGSEDGRTSPKDGDVKRPGISFVWENAPGKPKFEEKTGAIVPVELKPPPQTLPSIKVRDAAASNPPPAPAGTPPVRLNPFAGTLPLKQPSMPPGRAITTQKPSESTPAMGSSPTEKSVIVMPNGLTRSGHNSERQDVSNGIKREMNGTAPAASHILHGSSQERGGGNHHYLPERLPVAQPAASKDFYVGSRKTAAAAAAGAAIPNSRLAGRPDGDDNSAADSHSSAEWDDDGEHNSTDAGDIYSQMDHYQAQCQVSMLDGCVESELTDTSRHTDPSARDFIMQRFLPAAKAMVTESPDNDRRSSNGTPSDSPRRGSRSSVPGRSRFATSKQKQQYDDDERDDDDEGGMLFKCKFPWQVSPFGSLCLPAPAPQPGANKSKGDEKPEEDMESARSHQSVEPNRSFESRGPGANLRTRSVGSSTNTDGGASHHQTDQDILEHSQSFSVGSHSGDFYEGEESVRSNDSRRAYCSNHRDSVAPSTPPRKKTEHEFAGNLGTLLRMNSPTARKHTQSDPSEDNKFQSRQQLSLPSGSVPDLRTSDSDQTTSPSSPAPPNIGTNGEGSKNSRPLKLSLYRQEKPGDSRRSLESIDDEAWETIDRETGSSTPARSNNKQGAYYEQPRSDRVGLTSHSNSSDNADDARAIGWPLGKAYSALSRASNTDAKQDSPRSWAGSTDSKHGTGFLRTSSSESTKGESAYPRTASSESPYTRSSSSDSKQESPYARTGSADSKNESSPSMSDHSAASFTQQKEPEKHSPVSVLPPPLPKAPKESWLGKIIPAAPASLPSMGNRQQAGQKKFMEHGIADVPMDVKWESLVKSETAHLRNLRLAQDPPLSTRTGAHEV